MSKAVFFASIVIMACAPIAVAHPFHLCVGQMKWNNDSKSWEVSLRLHPQDLESAMTTEIYGNSAGKKVTTEDTDFPTMVTKFLNRHFFLRRTPIAMKSDELAAILRGEANSEIVGNGMPEEQRELRSQLTWVGMEQERGWLWLHFEMSQPQCDVQLQKFWLTHSVLLESVEKQENTIAIDPTISPKYSLQFQQGTPIKEFASVKANALNPLQ